MSLGSGPALRGGLFAVLRSCRYLTHRISIPLMALTRQQKSRRAAAARRHVLTRLKAQDPALYQAWLDEGYALLDDDGQPVAP